MASLRDQIVAKAESQLGVRYYSMHCGPKGSYEEGFGCAMLVAWSHNQVLGTNYYGSCWNFWGDAIGASVYNQGGGEFEVVDDPQPGDTVLYFYPGVSTGYSTNASHAALYVGDGKVIGSYGYGTPDDPNNYMKGGNVRKTTVEYQSLGGPIRYIRCKRLANDKASAPSSSSDKWEIFEMKKTITTTGVNIRDAPSTVTGNIVSEYPANSKVVIDGVVLNDGYAWGHYVGSSSGKDRYIALGSTEYMK